MISIALLVRASGAELLGLMSLPLIVGGVCIITSIIGTYMVRLGGGSIMGALYKGFFTSAVLSAFAIFGVTKWVLGDLGAVIGGEGFLDAPSDALTGSVAAAATATTRSEEHTSELQSLMRISYAVFCLKKKKELMT